MTQKQKRKQLLRFKLNCQELVIRSRLAGKYMLFLEQIRKIAFLQITMNTTC